jgi:hypothetical protein
MTGLVEKTGLFIPEVDQISRARLDNENVALYYSLAIKNSKLEVAHSKDPLTRALSA